MLIILEFSNMMDMMYMVFLYGNNVVKLLELYSMYPISGRLSIFWYVRLEEISLVYFSIICIIYTSDSIAKTIRITFKLDMQPSLYYWFFSS